MTKENVSKLIEVYQNEVTRSNENSAAMSLIVELLQNYKESMQDDDKE